MTYPYPISLKLSEDEANLLLNAITSLQEDMVTGFEEGQTPRIAVNQIGTYEALDDIWLRIFDAGLPAKSVKEAHDTRRESGLIEPIDWDTTPFGEQK